MTTPARRRRSLEELLGPAEPVRREGGRPVSPARQRLYRADADILEAKIAALRASHVQSADVTQEWASARQWLRSHAQGRLPRFLAILGDTPEARDYLQAELENALASLFATDGLPG